MELSEQITISEMATLAELDGIVGANNDIAETRGNCRKSGNY